VTFEVFHRDHDGNAESFEKEKAEISRCSTAFFAEEGWGSERRMITRNTLQS
jgi:hypothetical protein